MDDRDCGLTDKLFRLLRALGTGLVRTGNLREKMAEGCPIGVSIKFSMVSIQLRLLQQYPVPVILLSGVWSMTIFIMNMKPTSLPIR